MTSAREAKKSDAATFRAKLFLAMALVVSGLTAAGLYLAERNAAAVAERDLQRDFQAELASLHSVEELRYAALAERCRVFVEKPRLHAALEDNALDLLYPSAKDELRDVMQDTAASTVDEQAQALHARFYRFLDRAGTVLPPPNQNDVGFLRPEEQSQLALKGLPEKSQIGYLLRMAGTETELIDEIVALPITSLVSVEAIGSAMISSINSFSVPAIRSR